MPRMKLGARQPGFWWKDPRTGTDWVKLVHGEQHLQLLKPLPTAATVLARNRVLSITDKGPGKGAIAVIRRELIDQASGETLAQLTNVTFLRGDGGYSASSGSSDPAPPPLPAVSTCPGHRGRPWEPRHQALIYGLSGDYNVLHADPAVARAAGFSRPILHGLCTYGMAAHALLCTVCDYQAGAIRRLAVRFTAPVYPGESVRFQLWRAAAGRCTYGRGSRRAMRWS